MTAPRDTSSLRPSAPSSTEEDLMDVIGLMLGMTMLNVAEVNASAAQRIRSFLEEAMEHDFAREHALAVRSISAALDGGLIAKLIDVMDAGQLGSVTD
ncbi:MAG: hypothetical protein WBL20_15760, partial [Sphingobium sp.]